MLGCDGCCPRLMLVREAMADPLVFSVLVSSSQSFLVLAGCYYRPSFVKEYAVDQWIMWRTSHFLHHFLLSLVSWQTIFSWRYFPYLLVNEESQPFNIIMKLWEVDFLSWKCSLQHLELHAKRGGKNGASHGNHFSLSFLNYFEPFDPFLADMSLWMEWAGFPFFGLWLWLMAESHFFFFFF